MENKKKNLLSSKWISKYMKLARTLAEDNEACYSRKIGVVLVSNKLNRIISVGYNGAMEDVPHADSKEYLEHLWRNLMSEDQKQYVLNKYKDQFAISRNVLNSDAKPETLFSECFKDCENCPRKLLDIPSGQQMELCPCAHAERNCLASAGRLGVSTDDSTLFCYCAVPCHECGIQIKQSGVNQVVCLKADKDYSISTRYLFQYANVSLIEIDPRDIDSKDIE